ncbi:MAG: helix-turn-helix transcriptional regulator [Phycisphaerae bacterium]|nr:helix-turn-helix transcriptional regulator [Phycisphaerae bacterium]
MAMQIPIYRDDHKTYKADTCSPLVAAANAGKVRIAAVGRGSYPGRRLPDFALPQVRSLAYWDAPNQQDWGLDWHRNEGIELAFLESGSLEFSLVDQQHSLRPGDMTITRPWQPHRVGDPYVMASRLHWLILDLGVRRPNQPWKWPGWIVLTEQDLEELTVLLRHNEQPVWVSTPDIRHCFHQIARALDADREGSSISRLAAYLNELFVSILEMLRHKDISLDPSLSSTSRTVKLFLADLQSDLEHLAEPWTLRTMAEHCGLAETRFRHYCKILTNVTPVHFLERCRVDVASQMLIEKPQMTITQIAMACGFGSSQYFATVFKRHHADSPKAFRGRALPGKDDAG